MRPMHEGVSAAVALLAALPAAAQLWIAPRAGDTVLMRRPLLLQWNAAPGAVATLSYSLDTGRSWTLLQRDLEAPSYRWDVPVLDTVALLLRLHLESATSSALVAERRRAHTAPIRCVRFSPEGRYLVTTAEDGIVKLWTVPELEASDVLVIGTPALLSAAFLRDSTQVVGLGGFAAAALRPGEQGAPLLRCRGSPRRDSRYRSPSYGNAPCHGSG
jgi:hypothetical protein